MKKILWIAGAGAFLGGLFSSIFSPRIIGWYFEPPVEIGINCRPAADWAMAQLQKAQWGGVIGGAVLSLVILALFSKKQVKTSGEKSGLQN